MSATPTPAPETNAAARDFSTPDEVRAITNGRVEVLNLGGLQVMRATFEPGWRWSESVKPVAGTESCQVGHLGYMLTGRMALRMDNGTELELKSGDVGLIPAGHDAWVVGDEPVVFIDFQGASIYAKPQA